VIVLYSRATSSSAAGSSPMICRVPRAAPTSQSSANASLSVVVWARATGPATHANANIDAMKSLAGGILSRLRESWIKLWSPCRLGRPPLGEVFGDLQGEPLVDAVRCQQRCANGKHDRGIDAGGELDAVERLGGLRLPGHVPVHD